MSAGSQAVLQRETLISREMAMLNEEIARLDSIFSGLHKRLIPVLSQTPPLNGVVDKLAETETALPELVSKIRSARMKIASIATEMMETENRIEI